MRTHKGGKLTLGFAVCMAALLSVSCYYNGPFHYHVVVDSVVATEEEPWLWVRYRLSSPLAEGLGHGWVHWECRTTDGLVLTNKNSISYLYQGETETMEFAFDQDWNDAWTIESLAPVKLEFYPDGDGGIVRRTASFVPVAGGWEAVYP
jgi:hypothetical protein